MRFHAEYSPGDRDLRYDTEEHMTWMKDNPHVFPVKARRRLFRIASWFGRDLANWFALGSWDAARPPRHNAKIKVYSALCRWSRKTEDVLRFAAKLRVAIR